MASNTPQYVIGPIWKGFDGPLKSEAYVSYILMGKNAAKKLKRAAFTTWLHQLFLKTKRFSCLVIHFLVFPFLLQATPLWFLIL